MLNMMKEEGPNYLINIVSKCVYPPSTVEQVVSSTLCFLKTSKKFPNFLFPKNFL